jgi:hypothetical protein
MLRAHCQPALANFIEEVLSGMGEFGDLGHPHGCGAALERVRGAKQLVHRVARGRLRLEN